MVVWEKYPSKSFSQSFNQVCPGGKNIVDIAIATGNFTTQVTALQSAGLVAALKGEGPFTVFAPTDAAFAEILEEQFNALMANKTELTNLLNYHIVPGEVTSTDLKNGLAVRTKTENWIHARKSEIQLDRISKWNKIPAYNRITTRDSEI